MKSKKPNLKGMFYTVVINCPEHSTPRYEIKWSENDTRATLTVRLLRARGGSVEVYHKSALAGEYGRFLNRLGFEFAQRLQDSLDAHRVRLVMNDAKAALKPVETEMLKKYFADIRKRMAKHKAANDNKKKKSRKAA